ncbi:alpha-L-rhamnosidase C-terminal domain-containing protein [Curtobacterium sp. PhB136]|uniref:alpha-L-rhamnosidase-related protein n=1 Tax=Curtobacterium sp. PhB136 TaxID=2485181 RepID=UPI0010459766|nr:alpha-L-rhamnosidase C-terminal domain-containing protein [Curtobacterium sp. PhB136]TCK59245.1 alpha-L-rhamnosidase [Curtobacterium sp. PhB136]
MTKPQLTAPPRPLRGQWRHHLLGPDSDRVVPTGVLQTSGDVDVRDASGPITLTRGTDGPDAVVVLDHGRNIAGVPWYDLDGTPGAQLLVSFSESAAWTGPDGDLEGSHNESGNRHRWEELVVNGPGTTSTGRIQGGQRYQRIALTTPGTVTIRALWTQFSAFRPGPEEHPGWFLSSSELFNRIWFEGSYTVQINSLPPATLPEPWIVHDGALDADGGTLAVLDGVDLADGTVEFDVHLLSGAAGWIVRATPSGTAGYLLTAEVDPDRRADVLVRIWHFDDSINDRAQDLDRRLFPITTTRIESVGTTSDWLPVRTELAGSVVRVSVGGAVPIEIDLAEVADAPQYATGTVGFRVAWLDRARFRHLHVSGDGPSGDRSVDLDLDDAEDLGAFVGPAIGHPDPLPLILDGGKRDRTVWSGDLIVQIPTVFATTAAEPYVRGSLEYLNGYQEASGQSAARVPPIMPVAEAPRAGQTYSAVYSMHQVTNIALYHRYTGDRAFAEAQWPSVLRELDFDRTLLDDRGLIVTDEVNGLDWDWYDGPKIGAVTAYNAAFHATLQNAADLADAIGETTEATRLRAEAAALRTAINEHLYDAERNRYRLSDVLPDSVAQDGTALAVATGVVPDGDGTAVLTALASALPQTPYGPSPFSADTGFRHAVSPYVADSHLRALFQVGATEDAFALLRRLWGHMVTADVHAVGTTWELIAPDGSPGFGAKTSLAHGWGAGATAALTAHVLGISPTAPGFARWRFAPQPGDLDWAEGSVPTPHGPIEAAWERDGDGLVMTVTAPTDGTVVVPTPHRGRFASLSGANESDTSNTGVSADDGEIHLRAGSHRVTIR